MKRFLILTIVVVLTACAGSGPDYKNTPTMKPLEVPPDLSGIPVDDQASANAGAEDSAASYSGLSSRKDDPIVRLSKGMLPEFKSAHVMRAGSQRWLVVESEAEPLWLTLRTFLLKLGLLIAVENPETGIMETTWKETRPLEEDQSRSKTAQFLAKLHSTGKRDKFRFRFERGLQPGTMEVYVSHRIYEEVALVHNSADVMRTVWHPVTPDPVRETEMLRLFLVYLGNSKLESNKLIDQAGTPQELAKLGRTQKKVLELQLLDSQDRAWRRLGLALDQIGFTVQDRDRGEGIYYVQHLGDLTDDKKRGFFKRMFGGDKDKAMEYYQAKLVKVDDKLMVEIRDKNGKPEKSKTGEQILELLYEQLKY